MKRSDFFKLVSIFIFVFCLAVLGVSKISASDDSDKEDYEYGGGYAITEQISDVGYTSVIYDAKNGLSTSDAMCVFGASDGHVWIGGYSGVIRYDGLTFERLDASEGLTSARVIFEDSKGRIWVGTNDNGVVVIDRNKKTQLTYKDGLSSSSIRAFVEDADGNVFIGTTTGLCYADSKLEIHSLSNSVIDKERILNLVSDISGKIYGVTSKGIVFVIDKCKFVDVYNQGDLGADKITTILADPTTTGLVYVGTDKGYIYHGKLGEKLDTLKAISVSPIDVVHWLSYDCGRVWVSSTSILGYIDSKDELKVVEDNQLNSGIEMTTTDYQGNLWVASSTQGVAKFVVNNFVDISKKAGVSPGVTNCVYELNGSLYIGTDSGLYIVGENGNTLKNALTDYIGDARVRCINMDADHNIWVATYTDDKGLVCYHEDGTISTYTADNGLLDNQVRCVTISEDGCVLVGTNSGLVVIKDGVIEKTYGVKEDIDNTVFLTLEKLEDGRIMAGSDGGGLYVISDKHISKLGRDDGLTSDVILRIVKDDARDVYWIITSNSIEYMKGSKITQITTFPFNNNYDMYFDDNDNIWILSSFGVYCVNGDELLRDNVVTYKFYNLENGLPYAVTSNSFSAKDSQGNLYISGRDGVVKFNINNYYEKVWNIKTGLGGIYCDNKKIEPDSTGIYRIPASDGRVQIFVSVMDYTLLNPTVKVYLEGSKDEGIISPLSSLSVLEYTHMPYGNYTLHIQIIDKVTGEVITDNVYDIVKTPQIKELWIIRVVALLFVIIVAGIIVWRILKLTVVRKQYDAIRKAKDEAELANTAKSRFLANMSHEIRTPINTIMGMNEMVMREDAKGVPKGYFLSMMNYSYDIRNATESLLGLINDLLDMSKIESGKMHLVEQEYDTADMIKSLVSMIYVRSTEKELTFDVVVDEILPKRLYGDAGKIKQILLNLLTNAVKYTKKGGFSLSVSMEEREEGKAFLKFSVKDTGIGVKEEDMDKLFTAYERLDEEKNSGIQGTGLGLDISRRFAELMDGKLWCESVYGEGSEFILTVWQKIVDVKPVGAFAPYENMELKGPYVSKFIAPDADILVVDDNPMNLNVIKGLLKPTKVFVTTASSGEEALDKIRDSHFDVVLLDHMMPGMDGIDTLIEIRKIYPELPVYALTANSTAGEEFYISKGFNGYLSKPIDCELLEKTIMSHIPEKMMEIIETREEEEEIKELPESMLWLNDIKELDVSKGIENSGSVSNFIFALTLFSDTIDENVKVIKEAYEENNIRLYTIKVHALKTSARIIGALALSELSEKLENAGNHKEMEIINANTDKLLTDYQAFKEMLKDVNMSPSDSENKELIPDEVLKDAYSALKDIIPQMDYDSVEMILENLNEYKLLGDELQVYKELSRMLKNLDWEGMEVLMSKKI